MLHVMQLKRKDNETRDRGELVAYWCEACGGWHCGHKRTRAWSA
jgi:hypothetical protein